MRLGLLTNQTGLDAQGRRTIDVLRARAAASNWSAVLAGARHLRREGLDQHRQEVDPATGLNVTSLYGPKDADKRPKPDDLKDLDAVVIDLQDAGVRFYTYETVVGYFVEAAACEAARGHPLEVMVLDRPDLIGGARCRGRCRIRPNRMSITCRSRCATA